MTGATALQVLFWLSLFAIVWAYFGYFVLLLVLSLFRPQKINKQDWSPDVSLVITAYNEEKRIRQKIDNTLALSYPKEKLEVIIVSDGCTDSTEQIVKSYQDQGVELLAIPTRHGKHYGQGRGVQIAKSDIIILTDATTFLQGDAVEKIVRNFSDPEVGCVSGVDQLRSADSSASGEGMYVRYEMKLRSLESKVGSLVGVSGCFFAVRKELCTNWIDDLSSDFYLPSIAQMKGFRTVLEAEAIGYYEVMKSARQEFNRKVRTVVHGLEVLFKFSKVLNPFKYGMYSFQMLSHKLIRWLVPISLVFLLILNVVLFDMAILYQVFLIAQLGFYILALSGLAIRKLQDSTLFRVPSFFVLVNLSILMAWYKYLARQDYVLWESTRR